VPWLSWAGGINRVWFKRKTDPETLLRDLASYGEYEGAMDMYREFRSVFLTTDEGKRVLSQIMNWAHVMRSTADPEPIQMGILNGERNIGLKILSAIESEPKHLPTKARSR